MSAIAITTASSTEPAAENKAQTNTAPQQRGYNLGRHLVVAQLMQPGDSLYMTFPRVPSSKVLVQTQHFDYAPPFKGRDVDTGFYHRDITMCGVFTALVPLLVAIHDPWNKTGKIKGCRTIGHIRIARDAHDQGFAIAREIQGEEGGDILKVEPRWAHGCRDSHFAEHMVLGGPLGAVVYRDELVVPGFRYQPGIKDNLPFTYIVEGKDEELIMRAFLDGARRFHAAKEGRPDPGGHQAVKVAGILKTKQLGPYMVHFDKVFRVHRIQQLDMTTGEVKEKTFASFKSGGRLRVGEMCMDPKIRAALTAETPPVASAPSEEIPVADVVPKPAFRSMPPRKAQATALPAPAPEAPVICLGYSEELPSADIVAEAFEAMETSVDVQAELLIELQGSEVLPLVRTTEGAIVCSPGDGLTPSMARRLLALLEEDQLEATEENQALYLRLYEVWLTDNTLPKCEGRVVLADED